MNRIDDDMIEEKPAATTTTTTFARTCRLFKVLTHISRSTEWIAKHDNNGSVYFFPAIFRPHFSALRIIAHTRTQTYQYCRVQKCVTVLKLEAGANIIYCTIERTKKRDAAIEE